MEIVMPKSFILFNFLFLINDSRCSKIEPEPLGECDFKARVTESAWIVDKTLLIKALMQHSKPVILINRPRQFGKSMAASMLYYFFSIDEKPSTHIFNSFAIHKDRTVDAYRNTFPVVYFSLHAVTRDPETVFAKLSAEMQKTYRRFPYLESSDALTANDKSLFRRLKDGKAPEAETKRGVKFLCRFLHAHFQQNCFVVIDAYDAYKMEAFGSHQKPETPLIIKQLLRAAAKTNPHLHKAVIFGITDTDKDSFVSSPQRFLEDTIFRTEISSFFGFDATEVHELIKKHGYNDVQEEKFKELISLYGGYTIGNTTLYSPQGVMANLRGEKEASFWVEPTHKDKMTSIILEHSIFPTVSVDYLLADGVVTKPYPPSTEVFTREGFWSFFAQFGYLTVEGSGLVQHNRAQFVRLKIPNAEIRGIFHVVQQQIRQDRKPVYDDLIDSLARGDAMTAAEILGAYFQNARQPLPRGPADYCDTVRDLLVGLESTCGRLVAEPVRSDCFLRSAIEVDRNKTCLVFWTRVERKEQLEFDENTVSSLKKKMSSMFYKSFKRPAGKTEDDLSMLARVYGASVKLLFVK